MDDFDINMFADDNFCNYLSLNEFNDSGIGNANNYSILNINVRSLKKHFTELQTFLHICKCTFSFIVICETWLNDDYDSLFNIDGYLFYSLCRKDNYGGIRLYYRDNLNVELLKDFTEINGSCEILSARLVLQSENDIDLLCVYRPPSGSMTDFNIFINNILAQYLNGDKIIIAGDLNVNFF